MIHALGLQKAVAAEVNLALQQIPETIAPAMIQAAEEVAGGKLDAEFPLSVWQTGSGTQTNMNANEVIAGRANEILTGKRGGKNPVHPNDHVNRGQSSNDTIPAIMNIAALQECHNRLLPALTHAEDILTGKQQAFSEIVKTGRTHLQDATPLTLGQEFSGWTEQIRSARSGIEQTLPRLYGLAQGGTAVGTGLNSHPDFARHFADRLAERTGLPFHPAVSFFEGLAAHDDLLALHGAMNVAAAAVLKIANDVRLLGSGPRTGLGELLLPANEPGSSIMPGKVNPTQAEALTMVAAQVMGNQTTVSIACASGHLQLNAFKPVIAFNVLQSIRLLSDGITSFADRCLAGIEPNHDRIAQNLDRSLMLVTALNPHIGYDNAARIAKKAWADNISLKEAARDLDLLSEEDFDRLVRPEEMVKP